MDHLWQADEYQQHSSIQYEAAKLLLSKVKLTGSEQVLDVGCGDGKISAIIAAQIPEGSALAVDVSPQMIEFAKMNFPKSSYSNLSFLLEDAQELNYDQHFDLVFSSFAIQWFLNKSAFLKGACKSLKTSGHLALTIPLGISDPLEQAIEKITSLPKWSSYFQNFHKDWHFVKEEEFAQLLRRENFAITYFESVRHKTLFSTLEHFKYYVLQWFPYLRVIPEPLKEPFFNEIIDKYIEIEPILPDGKTPFNFSRLDVIARKFSPLT